MVLSKLPFNTRCSLFQQISELLQNSEAITLLEHAVSEPGILLQIVPLSPYCRCVHPPATLLGTPC